MTERYCRSNNLVFSRKVNDMIFVTGDIHGNGERFSSRRWRFGKGLNRNDAVIVAGDFGLPWSDSNTDTYWLDWLESKPWTTCFVDGNHENHALLSKQPTKKLEQRKSACFTAACSPSNPRRDFQYIGSHHIRHGRCIESRHTIPHRRKKLVARRTTERQRIRACEESA